MHCMETLADDLANQPIKALHFLFEEFENHLTLDKSRKQSRVHLGTLWLVFKYATKINRAIYTLCYFQDSQE